MAVKRRLLDGNSAAALAMQMARVQVAAMYPITPQSPIAEAMSEFAAQGSYPKKFMRVESEHSALSAAVGACLVGARAGTATSSVGLALMHEVLGVASGVRTPIVMPVVNRALVAPWSLWADHQDAMAERDSGWLQLYVENVQEVFDSVLMAYKIAEDPRVLLPIMVCQDGFFVSHNSEAVAVPAQEAVDAFLPPYEPKNAYLDPASPLVIDDLTPPTLFTELRYQQKEAFANALTVIEEVGAEYGRLTGRTYGLVEEYRLADAETALVVLGSVAGTMKGLVDERRALGESLGLLRIRSFRPFPAAKIRAALTGRKKVLVFDRSAGLGSDTAPLFTEVKAALAGLSLAPQLFGYVAGLGGRDVMPATLARALAAAEKGSGQGVSTWIDVNQAEVGGEKEC
jgi:pyruvate ferredoxin oxidoreductase alpha subunit